MNAIAVIFALAFLGLAVYESITSFSLFKNGQMSDELFERMRTSGFKEVGYLVSIIIIYFFKDNKVNHYEGAFENQGGKCFDCPLNSNFKEDKPLDHNVE